MPGPKGHRVGYLLVNIVCYIRLLNRSLISTYKTILKYPHPSLRIKTFYAMTLLCTLRLACLYIHPVYVILSISLACLVAIIHCKT